MIKERLANLIDVKSIMTLALTVVFCTLALTGRISGQEFITIFTVIVGFYFGTQVQKAAAVTTAIRHDTAVGTAAEENKKKAEAANQAAAQKIRLPDGEEARRGQVRLGAE